jgi:hypothetical protein
LERGQTHRQFANGRIAHALVFPELGSVHGLERVDVVLVRLQVPKGSEVMGG